MSNSVSVNGVTGVFEVAGIQYPNPKTTVFGDDPIALGCAAYRFWNTVGTSRWLAFEAAEVTLEDRELANAIRKYYRARTEHLLFDVLKHGTTTVSEFRKKLALIVADQYQKFTDQDRGILYRLPYFYHEDTAVDRVFANNASADYYGAAPMTLSQPQQLHLQLLEKILVSRKNGDTVQYWFSSADTPARYQWSVRTDNTLSSLVASIVRPGDTELRALIAIKSIRHQLNAVYYTMHNVELVT